MNDIASTSPLVFSFPPRLSCAKVTGAVLAVGAVGAEGAGVVVSSSITGDVLVGYI